MEQDEVKLVQHILLVILLLNILVAVLKILIGAFAHSSSIWADGLHSLSDGSSNVVGLIGVHLAAKPKDKSHPYGHNKFETLSGLFISVMLFFVGCKVVWLAVQRIKQPLVPRMTWISFGILVFTIFVNIYVAFMEYKKGRELHSQI